jgi:hypothetical protein
MTNRPKNEKLYELTGHAVAHLVEAQSYKRKVAGLIADGVIGVFD